MAKIMIIGTNMMNIYNHRLELINKLLSENMEVIIVAPKGKEIQKLIDKGVVFIDTPVDNRGMNPFKDFKLLMSLYKVLRSKKPDVVLTFYTKTNIYGGIACRLCNIPYIENITGLGSAISNGGLKAKLMKFLYSTAVAEASMVFFQNQSNKEFFRSNRIKIKAYQLLPGSGVSLQRYNLLPYPDDNTIQFLFVSRILKEKGIFEYIEAAKNIRLKYPNTIFHVVGPCDGEYLEFIKDAQERNIIKYHGKLYDLHPIIESTHCTVFPSYYAEGMANVLLESAASGRPIITTNLPGCGEAVDDEITGFVVNEKDAENLSQVIEKFILLTMEEKIKMGKAGRNKMEREFDRNIVVNAYIDAIYHIIGDTSSDHFHP